jgi:hypothetical protein
MALTSQTGEGGGWGVGVVPPVPVLLLFFLQDRMDMNPKKITMANAPIRILLMDEFCLRITFKIVVFVFKNN